MVALLALTPTVAACFYLFFLILIFVAKFKCEPNVGCKCVSGTFYLKKMAFKIAKFKI